MSLRLADKGRRTHPPELPAQIANANLDFGRGGVSFHRKVTGARKRRPCKEQGFPQILRARSVQRNLYLVEHVNSALDGRFGNLGVTKRM